ncbi:uncharacterized protein M6B38_349055 [Iris pallida]|uniref:Uncharacterized protein n=1 Tax=Iris pallida TaxID=29817 RepID=A0AAX6GT55_IRIPA|nr:uncharacterized protein M6B38_349055 [Iris pallida]
MRSGQESQGFENTGGDQGRILIETSMGKPSHFLIDKTCMGHHLNRVTPQNQNTGERGQTQPATYIEIEYISTIRSRLSRYEGLLQASSLLRSSLLSQSQAIHRVTRY